MEATTRVHTIGSITPPAERAGQGGLEEMRRLPHRAAFFCLTGDAFVSLGCLILAFWLRFHGPLQTVGIHAAGLTVADYAGYIVFGALGLIAALAQRGLYDAAWVVHRQPAFWHIATACLIWCAAFHGLSLFFKFEPPLSRVYTGLATLVAAAGLYAWRHWAVRYLSRLMKPNMRQRILVVGWTPAAERLARAINADPYHPCEIICCVPPPGGHFQLAPSADLVKFGSYGEIVLLLEALAIDVVLVADFDAPAVEWGGLADLCEKELVQFKVMPSYFKALSSGLQIETLGGVPILGVNRLPLDRLCNRIIKRSIDVAGALAGLILSAPLVAIFGTLVYLESPGPIFYRQRRTGRHGKVFEVVKLRSMRLDAEKGGHVGWSTTHDPRRLRIGAFMRRWNIDEVPQFWNVLEGDMSLVGPRPERPELISGFKHHIAHYNARHIAKPGITGWAQVNGLRGDTDLSERIRHDLHYVENWSPVLDLRLMLLTFFKNKNAC